MLSAWDQGPVSVINSCSGDLIDLPISTIADQKSLILLDGSQFVAPSGRWTVEFDFNHCVSNSMRPPPVPIVVPDQDVSSDDEEIQETKVYETTAGPYKGAGFGGMSNTKAELNSQEPVPNRSPRLVEDYQQLDEYVRPILYRGITPAPCKDTDLRSPTTPIKLPVDFNEQRQGQESVSIPSTPTKIFLRAAGEESQTVPQEPYVHKPVRAAKPNAQTSLLTRPEVQLKHTPASSASVPVEVTDILSRHVKKELQVVPQKRVLQQDHTDLNIVKSKALRTDQPHASVQKPHLPSSSRSASAKCFPLQAISGNVQPNKRRNFTPKNLQSSVSTKLAISRADAAPSMKYDDTTSTASESEASGHESDLVTADVPKARIQATSTHKTKTPEVDLPTRLVRSRRRSLSKEIAGSTQVPAKPKVLFSKSCSIQKKAKNMQTFTDLGATVVDKVANADILCVPTGGLMKTPKLILAITLGKSIVTEEWIRDTHRQSAFPDPATYLPKDKAKEREWGFCLAEAVKRNRNLIRENSKLLKGWNVYITPQLQKKLSDLLNDFREIASAMGAEKVYMRIPSVKARTSQVLVLGDDNDLDAIAVGNLGHILYTKDILTSAALRCELEIDSNEFKLEFPIKMEDSQE